MEEGIGLKLIVIDIDRLKWMSIEDRKKMFSQKVCILKDTDFGKKTLLSVPKNDPTALRAELEYEDRIFTIKDDDEALKHENAMFRKLLFHKKIKYFRVGVILRREKAIKILQRLLGIG